MSSNIQIQRICQYCNKEFTARTTVTKYCSDLCAKRAYKARKRNVKIENSNTETQRTISKPIEELKAKEFLTVKDVAKLLNCSIHTTYRLIERRNIKAVNLAERKTLVKRSDIDLLFENSNPKMALPENIPSPPLFTIDECYTIKEVQKKYHISDKGLHDIIKRNNVPKFRKGWFAYVPKTIIDKLFK